MVSGGEDGDCFIYFTWLDVCMFFCFCFFISIETDLLSLPLVFWDDREEMGASQFVGGF